MAGHERRVREIGELLRELLTQQELREFLQSTYDIDLVHSITWGLPYKVISFEAVNALYNRGYITRSFFKNLSLIRPERHRTIEIVAEACGLELRLSKAENPIRLVYRQVSRMQYFWFFIETNLFSRWARPAQLSFLGLFVRVH